MTAGWARGGDRAPQFRRHLGVAHREGLHRQFVDEAAGAEMGAPEARQPVVGDDRLRHDGCRVGAEDRQFRIVNEGPVELLRIGVDEQLRGIEPVAVVRRIAAIGTVAVARTGNDAIDMQPVYAFRIARHRQAADLGAADWIEQAEFDPLGMMRPDGEIRTPVGQCYAAPPCFDAVHLRAIR